MAYRQDFFGRRGTKAPTGKLRGGGVPIPARNGSGKETPQKIFDYLIFKWHILMHISGILDVLILHVKFCCATHSRIYVYEYKTKLRKGGAYINQHYNFSNLGYRTKLSRLASFSKFMR